MRFKIYTTVSSDTKVVLTHLYGVLLLSELSIVTPSTNKQHICPRNAGTNIFSIPSILQKKRKKEEILVLNPAVI
jgi:hypothetical protein